MKYKRSMLFLLIISPLICLASSSVGTAFAVSANNITVTGNSNTWNEGTGGNNQIDSDSVNIIIDSNVNLNSMQCRLERADGSIVENFEPCLDTPSTGHKAYPNLNGEYTFTLKVADTFSSTDLHYEFNTFGSGGQSFAAAPDVKAESTTLADIQIKDGQPPWSGCPSGTQQEEIPGFIKEIRYETIGNTDLKKVLKKEKQEIDLEVVVNFVSNTASGHLSDGSKQKFAVHSTHTECEYVAPKSSFSPESGTIPGVKLNQENSQFSNPPFKSCTTNDESAKYEINTKISDWESQQRINSIRDNLQNNQDLKIIIVQFFKKKTGESDEPWYMGELVIEGGKEDGTKIDLDLTGSDIHTTCLENFIA